MIERFVCNFENSNILKTDHWFRKSSKTPFCSDNMFSERSKHIKPYPLRLIMADFQQEKSIIMYSSGFFATFKIVIKWFLLKEYDWSLFKLNHQLMKQIFHKNWNPANLTREATGESYALLSKTGVFDNEELCLFNEISTLISGLLKPLTLVQGKYVRKKK